MRPPDLIRAQMQMPSLPDLIRQACVFFDALIMRVNTPGSIVSIGSRCNDFSKNFNPSSNTLPAAIAAADRNPMQVHAWSFAQGAPP